MKQLQKALLCCLLAFVMVFAMFTLAACKNDPAGTSSEGDTPSGDTSDPDNMEIVEEDPNAKYTYKDWVTKLSANWNPHTYEESDDSYPIDFISSGLYTFVFNDELHKVDGMDPYTSYVAVPEMAASDPVDVTTQIKSSHPQFGIPDDATSGYAYTIDLRKDATFQDGTQIKAEDYVESMKRLLDPRYLNYRAADYTAPTQTLVIAGGYAYNKAGQAVTAYVMEIMEDEGLDTIEAFLEVYGEEIAYINWDYSFGEMFNGTEWVEDGFGDELVETQFTLAQARDLYVEAVTGWGYPEETALEFFMEECAMAIDFYPENPSWDTVGCFASDEYQITLVFAKPLSGFYLYYNLSGNWLVKTDLYDSCLKQDGDAWFSTYNTSVETTCSYGPYKMVSFQSEKAMRFEKNENWYGWTDNKHIYVDPVDGKTYRMYQTTAVECQVITEFATRKAMFLKGELMTYGLDTDDFADYRSSEFLYNTPGDSTFFFILNGHKGAIAEREAAADFDQSKNDLETITLPSFRMAFALSWDRDAYCAAIDPANTPGLGLLGPTYVVDPAIGLTYRETDAGKKALCDFYGVDPSNFADLDAAVDSITGYDLEQAAVLYQQAFEEALEAGYITDADGDGKCDQKITIVYANGSASDPSEKAKRRTEYLNTKITEATAGTPFENCISIEFSAPLGNGWVAATKGGTTDIILAGWTGSRMDPFGLMTVYADPVNMYDAEWFDATTVEMTLTIDGKSLTANLFQWVSALNGEDVKFKDGNTYNFGDGKASIDTRVEIMAGLEGKVLLTYDYIPFILDASMSLLSQQVYYVVDDYNIMMGRGGIQYMRYNYNDEAWTAHVAEQGGELKY